jgi:tetratricopeptide (TPR) repeat protein
MRRSAFHFALLGVAVCSGARTPLVARRAILALSPLAAVAQASPADAAGNPVRAGMRAFSQGKVEESISLFDAALSAQPELRPYLWQRGLSLYYADRFRDGAEQFAADVAVNPNDTEETIWNMLCQSLQSGIGFAAAQKNMLLVGYDRRPVMRAALELFRGETDEVPLKALAAKGSASDVFYAALYLGLFREAQGDVQGARQYITAAAASPYSQQSGDYMADLAKVHVQRRGW